MLKSSRPPNKIRKLRVTRLIGLIVVAARCPPLRSDAYVRRGLAQARMTSLSA